MASNSEVQRLQDLANQLRILSIQSTDASKSGWVIRLCDMLQSG